MKMTRILTSMILLFCCAGFAFAGIEGMLVQTGLDILTRPDNFFMEMNTDIEDTGSTFDRENLQLSTSLSWHLGTVANMQARYRACQGPTWISEVYTGISGWYIWGTAFLSEEGQSATIYGYTPFITFSRNVEDNMKFFAGLKYAVGSISFKMKDVYEAAISESLVMDLSGFSDIDAVYREFALYTGINHLLTSGKEVTAQIGYYPALKKLYSKVQLSGHLYDYGFGLYPEGALSLHFFWNLHINI